MEYVEFCRKVLFYNGRPWSFGTKHNRRVCTFDCTRRSREAPQLPGCPGPGFWYLGQLTIECFYCYIFEEGHMWMSSLKRRHLGFWRTSYDVPVSQRYPRSMSTRALPVV